MENSEIQIYKISNLEYLGTDQNGKDIITGLKKRWTKEAEVSET